MNSNLSDKYRRRLQQHASRVRLDASGMVEQVHSGSGGNGGSDLSNVPLHLGDMGTDEYLYDMNTTLLENEQYLASEARDALRRLDDGTFGKCEACGRAMSRARLDAIPYARYCVKCAASNDIPQVNYDEGRPHVPKDTLAPEGEMEEDRLSRVHQSEYPAERLKHGDIHAAGTAGGGTAVGGLAGSNEGDGDPIVIEADEAMGSGSFDIDDDRPDENTPMSGFTGGAVGGTPARKRAK